MQSIKVSLEQHFLLRFKTNLNFDVNTLMLFLSSPNFVSFRKLIYKIILPCDKAVRKTLSSAIFRFVCKLES